MAGDLFPDPQVAPYTLPLSLSAFERGLRTGHGRVLQHARRTGLSDDEQGMVLHACLFNVALDAQLEEPRHRWLLALLATIPTGADVVQDFVDRAVMLSDTYNWYWDTYQRCSLLRVLAERGVTGARDALYAIFRASRNPHDPIGGEAIVRLDGAAGLVEVCAQTGRWANDEDFWVDRQFMRVYDELNGPGAAMEVLERYRGDADINACLQAVERSDDAAGRPPQRTLSAADVIEAVHRAEPYKQRGRMLWLGQWGKRATSDDLMRIAAEIKNETSSANVARYLTVFRFVPMPMPVTPFLPLLMHDERDVRHCAGEALGQNRDDSIRQAALRKLAAGVLEPGVIRLFTANYQHGDHRAIEAAMSLPEDVDARHDLMYELISTFRPQEQCHAEVGALMRMVYEHSPCSDCRAEAVKIMRGSDTLPAWMADEFESDAVMMSEDC